MRIISLIALLFLFACKQKNTPDVSHIKVNLAVQRFEKDFFTIDTNDVHGSYDSMQQKYHSFLGDFLYNILALPNNPDSARDQVSRFLNNYGIIYRETEKKFTNMDVYVNDIKHSFQLTKYYFPEFNIPQRLITFVGPVEGYSSVLTQEGPAIGLQQYLGKDFPLYQSEYVREIYPAYQVRRFEPAYIPVNVMKNIVDDLYPPTKKRLPLIEIMIEQGKKLQLMKFLMPETSDTLLTGYTEAQLEGCYENEGLIWNFFIQNDLLYQSDPFIIRDYINDGPKTATMGESSPGNIGQFVGWQIVKKYLDNNEISPKELMNKSAKEIFAAVKYKPK